MRAKWYYVKVMKRISNSNILFIHRVLKGIADAIISVFIPLIIYKQTGNLVLSFVFIAVQRTSMCFYGAFFKKFIRSHPVICITFHFIPAVISQLLLLTSLYWPIIILLGLLAGMTNIFYYMGLQFMFGFVDKPSNTAKISIAAATGKIIFTLISAYIIGNIKESLVFVIIASCAFYVISVIPLMARHKEFGKMIVINESQSLKETLKKGKWFYFYEMCFGTAHMLITTVLPLFLYYSGLSFTKAGILIAMQDLINILGNVFAHFSVKKGKVKFMMIFSSALVFVSILLIIFVRDMYVIYALSIIASFAIQSHSTASFELFIKHQKPLGIYQDSLFYWEISLNFARAMTIVHFIFLQAFPIIFAISLAGSVGMATFGCAIDSNYNVAKNSPAELSNA